MYHQLDVLFRLGKSHMFFFGAGGQGAIGRPQRRRHRPIFVRNFAGEIYGSCSKPRRCREKTLDDIGRLKNVENSSNSDPGGTLFGDLFRNISCGFGDLMVICLAIVGFPSHQIDTFHQEGSLVWSWILGSCWNPLNGEPTRPVTAKDQ